MVLVQSSSTCELVPLKMFAVMNEIQYNSLVNRYLYLRWNQSKRCVYKFGHHLIDWPGSLWHDPSISEGLLSLQFIRQVYLISPRATFVFVSGVICFFDQSNDDVYKYIFMYVLPFPTYNQQIHSCSQQNNFAISTALIDTEIRICDWSITNKLFYIQLFKY